MKPSTEPRPSQRDPSERVLAVVPARLRSTRLPEKMLLRETGRFLFEHTVRNVEASGAADRVVLATDSERIETAAKEVGIDAVRTAESHESGTDRVHETVERLAADGSRFDVVLGVQGDEPELAPECFAQLVAAFADGGVNAATLSSPLVAAQEADDPNVVKVVCDAHGDALYFSRAPIPHDRDAAADGWRAMQRHIGVYAFRPDALRRFTALPASRLERRERLEQLRWLEAGETMRVVAVAPQPAGIDTQAQYQAFVARTSGQKPIPTRT